MQHAKRIAGLIFPILTLAVIITGCGPGPAAVDPTAQVQTAVVVDDSATAQAASLATSTPPPTVHPASPTVEPQPTSGQDTDGEAPPIATLCLQIDQSYPEIEEDFSLPIQETAEAILEAMDVTVVAVGDACDATLQFSLTGNALWVQWEDTPKCYNGAEVTGRVTLTGVTITGLPRSVSGKEPIPFMNYGCIQQPADAPWERAWAGALLDGLAAVWGPQALVAALDLPDTTDNQAQAVADAALKLETSQALEVLGYMLEHEDSTFAKYAVDALGELGPEACPLLGQAISHPSDYVRKEAAYVLRGCGAEAVPALIQALGDEWFGVRSVAANSLGDVGPEALEAVPALIQALDDEATGVRSAATNSLGDIGPEALEAVPALILRLSDVDEHVQSNALEALVAITGEDFGAHAAAWQAWWDAQD